MASPAPRPLLARSAPSYALLVALLVLLALFLLYPIILTVSGAFVSPVDKSLTLSNLFLVFEDPSTLRGLSNSLKIATGTTTLTLLIALPLAVAAAKFKFPGKAVFSALILVPLILPPFVGAIGMQALLGREGAINAILGLAGLHFDFLKDAKIWGVIVVQALALYPIIYLNATAALANLDPALEEAAENLGAGPWRRFFLVVLPLIRPGLFAGATIVFIWSLTELGTPLAFDYNNVTPVQVFNGLKEVETSATPYALTVVMLALAIVIYALGRKVFGGRAYAMYAKASRASSEQALRGLPAWLVTSAFALVITLALLPHLGVVLTALTAHGSWNRSILPQDLTLGNFATALSHPDAVGSVRNSLQLSISAVAINLVLGILVGYILVRTRILGRGLLDALCMLPLAVPGLVMAFGYVAMSLRWPFGQGNPLSFISVVGADPNPIPLLVAAYAVRRLPYIVRATVAGLEQTSGELEEAAMNLGASRFYAVRKVILPLIAANLIAGSLLAFSFSMLEVSDSLILAQQPSDFPVTKAIYSFLNRMGDGPAIASAMGVWGMALLTITLVGASILLGKKLGSLFRV
jgi:iron(III) transport system permease protein